MIKNALLAASIAFTAGAAVAQRGAEPAPRDHRLLIQVSDNDPARMALALNNAANASQHYAKLGKEVQVEIVAYGPGLHMLRQDTSPVKERVASFRQGMPNVSFTACGNTMQNMTKAEGAEVRVLPSVKIVEAGVTRIMELQEAGWSYVRP